MDSFLLWLGRRREMSLDHVGRQLGNYQLTRLLGKGGFAHVYLGRHKYLHSHAALKILQITLAEKETRRFQQEAQTLVHLIHPHIVRILDFFVAEGAPVLIMDYASGGTLRQCHPRGTQLPLPTIVDYVQQISAALQYAHQHGIIHRDIKPENILLGADKQLLLSDFGLALFAPSPEMLSIQEMAGTLLYMAPEQLRGKPLFASDQYSLAIMVYEWLCGAGPFVGTYWELMQQHLAVAPQSIRKMRADIPGEVEKVIFKALTKNPQERFSSVADFATALQQAAAGKTLDWKNNSTVPMPAVSIAGTRSTRRPLSTSTRTAPQGAVAMASSAPPLATAQPEAEPTNILLTASPVDAPLVARLQSDLLQLGIHCLNGTDPLISLTAAHSQQAMQRATTIAILVSAYTEMTAEIRQQLRQTASQQHRLIYLWIEGDEITTVLSTSGSLSQEKVIIDARTDYYEVALKKLATCLKNPSTSIHTYNPTQSNAPDGPYASPPRKASGHVSSFPASNPSKRAHSEENHLSAVPGGQLMRDIVASLHASMPAQHKRQPVIRLSLKKAASITLLLLCIVLIPLGVFQLHSWQQRNIVTTTTDPVRYVR
jgi:serine/threonine protein kinase